MKFVCDRCQTRYSIADEKVRQKILRIRCKTCGNTLVIDGSRGGPTGSGPRTQPIAKSNADVGLDGRPAAYARTAASSGPKSSPAARVAGSSPKPPPPPPADGDLLGGRVEWYVAVHGVQSGPFSRAEVAKHILAVEPGKMVHVWKDGMAKWKPFSEVSVIAREFSVLRRKPAASRSSRMPPPPPPPPSAGSSPKQAPAAKPQVPAEGRTPNPFPGQPLTPGPEQSLDEQDTPTDPYARAFAEITTKKGKELRSMVTASERDSFGDTTTLKGKNLRDLESQALFEEEEQTAVDQEQTVTSASPLLPKGDGVDEGTSPAGSPLPPSSAKPSEKTPPPVRISPPVAAMPPMEKTPPPVRPLPPVAATPPGEKTPPPVRISPPVAASVPAPMAPLANSPVSPALTKTPAPVDVLDDLFVEVADPGSPTETEPIESLAPLSPIANRASAQAGSARAARAPGAAGRQRGLTYIAAAAGLVVLIILLVVVTLRGDSGKSQVVIPPGEITSTPIKPEPPKVEDPKPEPKPEDDKPQDTKPTPGEKPAPSAHGGGKHGVGKSVRSVGPAPAPPPPPAPTRAEPAHPNPFNEQSTVSQERISAVVRNRNNQAALKSCYERALKMDNRLTSGRMDVTVSIGMSGMVQRVVVNAPSSFILVEPCIKSAVKRWVFPPSSEEYAANFPLIMQGGM
jgi:predicted Zn finger-like uncharacterized protein